MKIGLIAALLMLVTACDTKGTCLVDRPDPKRSRCMVNAGNRGCEDTNDAKFYKEDSAAGLARCSAAGFDVTPDRDEQKKLKNDEMVLFFKY